MIASLISSAFFLAGGIGSIIGVAAGEAETLGAGALGALKATGLGAKEDDFPPELAPFAKGWEGSAEHAKQALQAAQSQVDAANKISRSSGATTAALYLVGNSLFKYSISGQLPYSHLSGLAALAVTAALWSLLPPLALSAVTAAVLLGVAAWDAHRHRGWTPVAVDPVEESAH